MQNSTRRNIVVTGSNKGVGFAIVETLLAGTTPYDVILTSRSTNLGEEAYNTLKKKYSGSVSTLTYHQLDINDEKSIDNFAAWLKSTKGKLDVLVNNAAVSPVNPTDEQKKYIVETNFFNTVKLTEKLIPLLADDGKILLISSTVGTLSWQGPTLKSLLEDEKLTEKQLFEIANNFSKHIVDFPKDGLLPEGTYPASKALLNAYIRRFLPNKLKKTQQTYAICPGMVDTDMKADFFSTLSEEKKAELQNMVISPSESADTPVYLINLSFENNSEINAKFFSKRQIQVY